MPGVFSKSARPLRPGPYFDWNVTEPPVVPAVIGTVAAIPFTSDWGPFKTPTLVGSWAEYLAKFGPTVGTPGYNAAWMAFQGEGGFEGRYGAGAVLCYRMGGSSAAKATHTFQNTAGTPANALRLDAKYEGVYGNNIAATTQDHIADPTQNELLVYVNGTLVETYVYPDTNLAALAALVNAQSAWVTAAVLVDGSALAAVTSTALTGGDSGTSVLAADWTAMQAALETQAFGIFVAYGLTDSSILAALKAWAGGPSSGTTGRNANGQRFEVVVGGASDEAVSAATARSLTFNDGNFVNVGMGHVIDNNLLDANGNPTVLSPAQLTARVAGILAQRGESMSITSARIPGVTLLNGANAQDVAAAILGGVVVLTQDSDPDAPVHIEAARTTFTKGAPGGAAADAKYPYVVFRNPKFMRTMQSIEMEWTAWAQRVVIGKLPVNNKTRDTAVAEMTQRCKARAGIGVIQSVFTVAIDDDPPPSDDDEFIALKVGLGFGRSAEQFFFTVNAH